MSAFFSFHLTMDTLALGYTLPTTRACYGLSPIRLRPYWAHHKKQTAPKLLPVFIFISSLPTNTCEPPPVYGNLHWKS